MTHPNCTCRACVSWLSRGSIRQRMEQFFERNQFLLFFLLQFFLYGLLVWNYRAVVNIWPGSVATTDFLVAVINFKVISRITKQTDHDPHGPAFWGYVLGGVVGSLTSMYASLWWFGK